jgi:hypothetical protein
MKTSIVCVQWHRESNSSNSYYNAGPENWIWTGNGWKILKAKGRRKRCPKNGVMFGEGWGIIHVPTIPIVKYAVKLSKEESRGKAFISQLSEERARENFVGYLRTYVRNCLLETKQTGLLFLVGGIPRVVRENVETFRCETNIGLYLFPQKLNYLAEIQPMAWCHSSENSEIYPEWVVSLHDEKPMSLEIFNLKDRAKKVKA